MLATVTSTSSTLNHVVRTQRPPRLLPVLYFGVAHVALALAFAAVAADPRGVSGFFYHARMLAVVHLVTLGWITASILGSLYLVGPIALRAEFPAAWRGRPPPSAPASCSPGSASSAACGAPRCRPR